VVVWRLLACGDRCMSVLAAAGAAAVILGGHGSLVVTKLSARGLWSSVADEQRQNSASRLQRGRVCVHSSTSQRDDARRELISTESRTGQVVTYTDLSNRNSDLKRPRNEVETSIDFVLFFFGCEQLDTVGRVCVCLSVRTIKY